jgi:polysaccharide biosynthesis protein PslG
MLHCRRFLAGLLLGLLVIWLSGCRRDTGTTPAADPSARPLVTDTIRPQPTATPTPKPTTPAAASPAPVTAESTRSLPTASPTPAFPLYHGPPLDPSRLGVQIHLHRENVGQIIEQLRALGMGWVKVQVSWKVFQPATDRYDEELLAELDRLIAAAQAHDIRVLLGVAKAPDWSRPLTEQDGPPRDPALFRSFMAFLAGRYGDGVAAYELWNEPNLQREWQGFPLSPAATVELMAAGAAGVRDSGSQAILVSGAPATTGINDGVTAIDDRQFLRQMVAAGLLEVVDAVGAHPYGWANPPDSRAGSPDPAVPSHNNHPSFFFADTLADYRAILTEAGRPDMLIWVTEFGWGSFDGLAGPPPDEVAFMANVSEWQQAEYTLRAFELAQAEPAIGPLFLWNLNFGPLLGAEYSETGFSLLRPDGSHRPVFEALAAAAKIAPGQETGEE